MIGDLLFLPRTFQEDERTKVEGYFAHKWGIADLLPQSHFYKAGSPAGKQSLILSGVPEVAGSFVVNVRGANQWGVKDQNFTLVVNPIAPKIQTQSALQVGSTSASLRGHLFENCGESVNVSFEYGVNNSSLDQNTTPEIITNAGIVSKLLTGLTPDTTYFYKAWASNSKGQSSGEALSIEPLFDWPLRSINAGDVDDMTGRAP